ncbi:MAG: UDP-N-acetylmuramate dehydrogenase [Clostridiales bacterium]|nr:UDP-N-acetylmuramate dehydrogenase [Clostridiales bacterium]
MPDSAILRLLEKIPAVSTVCDCDMRLYTSFKAGGKASVLIAPNGIGELRQVLAALSQSGIGYMVIGNGTNILVSDNGYRGAIVKIGEAFSWIEAADCRLVVGAGASMAAAAKAALAAGLAGLEFASGIPGSVGGAVFMNAGAYGSEMKDVVSRVDIISKDGQQGYKLSSEDMSFSYRHSSLQDAEDVITGATFELEYGDTGKIKEKMREFAELRNSKQPVSMPSAGSFFKRPSGHFAGKLIEDCGLKGLSVGGASVSALHAGFIVNNGNATATDIIDLMNLVRHTVYDKFAVKLEPEVRVIGGM